MRVSELLTAALVASLLAGCADQGPGITRHSSGVTGRVQLEPQCPVETPGDPCDDKPAVGSRVTIARQNPENPDGGEVVARTTTDADGRYRVAVSPGKYVVRADAGMSCEPMTVRVTLPGYAKVDIFCDTGIR